MGSPGGQLLLSLNPPFKGLSPDAINSITKRSWRPWDSICLPGVLIALEGRVSAFTSNVAYKPKKFASWDNGKTCKRSHNIT